MDSYEATRVVFSRIQNLDPDNASKIMGLLLIQDHGEKEMIRLAFGPESLVHSIVVKAKKDLGLSSSNTPTTPSSPMPFSRHNSSNSSSSSRLLNGMSLPSPLSIPNPSPSNSSWAAASNFSEDLVSPNTCLNHYYDGGVSNLGIRSSSSSTMNSSAPPFYGNGKRDSDLIDEFELQDQLSFLNDGYYPDSASSPNGSGSDGGARFNSYVGSGAARSWNGGDTINGLSHRRSCSVSDVFVGSDDPAGGFGWKPCLYYARGYCKNGTSCRFLHEGTSDSDALVGSPSKLEMMEQCHELLRSKSAQQQRLALASQLLGGSNFPYSPKAMNLLLQQQNDSPRAAAAAAALMLGEEMKFAGSPRLERSEFAMNGMVNPVSRQIYLTFPADSTFREEDVSNYFSIFGPVQDVRIPYQQKRMFGFVTFVYPDTVKLILAKGNPHFVCDARVLVKPYKEKGKVPDKFRKQQHMDRLEFAACGSPTGLDLRDPYDLHFEARMLQNSQDILWRRKMEEQADLHQAIDLQNQRLLNLQLLDVKRSNHHRAFSTGAVISSPMHSPNFHNRGVMLSSSDQRSPEFVEEENGSALASANNAPVAINLQQIANVNETEKCLSSLRDQKSNDRSPRDDKENDLLESLEHNLPDNLFSSPKAAREYMSAFSSDTASVEENGNEAVVLSPAPTNNLMASSSTLDMASLKSCYFQAPRFASNHGAIKM
ncbi:Zinc finger CCCH domain-containing protein 53 [Heracleum sosnowskyi]|uniref:Zinc finger CCCH domain-containing protein 53 n=1 Tax=Heracleum sosnowskyi TaxID=360622 RepID=A0AAD8H3S1_9APIA|nr:Zinc finger CCCH domain-containing protein 53 [Heracleum sosnowskyi]